MQAVARELFGREPAKSVNPDEAVAIGAAIQAGVISGEIEELLLLDVTPLSLGIEVEGGVFRSLIPRNSSIPTVATRRFTTTRDNQQAVYVHVLQGERANAAENRTLAHFRLTDIPPAPAELPEIEVRFAIDADGILSVAATDMTSGVQKEIIVESYMPTQTRESERIVHEAEEKAEEDREFARRAARKQAALDTRRSVASFLDKSKDKLSEEDQALVASLMFRLDVALHADNVEAIEETEQSLLDLCNRYSDLFYVHRIEEQ
ncbi:MAG: Chaperone protein DnaK [candidate division BRC1 bacterium ADurb.BinA364]|nr:MAG: Chaperone protein DnaK [candidate division BRC1 bacterium ADurb.BinA364]